MRIDRSWRRPWLALFLLFLAGPLGAHVGAQDVAVSARLSAGVLRLGDSGEVHITVEGAESARIVGVPSVAGLRFGEARFVGENRFSQVRGGRFHTEISLSFRIPFRPETVGDYEIPPVEVEVGKQRFATKPLRLTVAEDLEGADYGYLEVKPSAPFVVEGQPFTVELTFGWDANDKVGFAELNLPWWDSLPGALVLDSPSVPPQSRVEGIEVNGARVDAEQAPTAPRAGREFVTLKIRRTYLPTRAAALEFPTSFFEFGRDRQISIFNTRRESHFVKAEPFTVEVVPLPTEGQPADFSGAVGKFSMRASVDARDVRVGDSVKLAVEWSGQGNLQFFTPPDLAALDAFRGFRVYGTTEEKSFERRKVVYDLAPLSTDVKEIPALALPLYDPAEKRYTSVASAPIPLRVRPLERSGTLADADKTFERDLVDIDARPLELAGSSADGGKDGFLAVALVLVPLVGLLLRAEVRRRHGDPDAPRARARRRAEKVLRAALAESGSPAEDLAAFHAFLGARTGEPAEAWNGRDLARWNAEQSPPLAPELAQQLARGLARLDGAVYGGAARVGSEELLLLARSFVEARR